MKQFISDCLNTFLLITGENDTHYICGNTLFRKDAVITEYHPLDDLKGKLHLVTYEFVNY